ncbi:MAG: collagen-like protein [Candidatus Protochlamydia sp.]|nr:collagen-like protein [Candidatus Protochlamydia sp.]
MIKFRITMTSLFAALLFINSAACAQENKVSDQVTPSQTNQYNTDTYDVTMNNALRKPCCKDGLRGKRGPPGRDGITVVGPAGAPGPQGPQGVQGPTGVNGSLITTYISAAWVLPEEGTTPQINQGEPIPFNTLISQGGAVTPYVNGSGIFQVNETGHYEITYSAKWTTSTPIALEVFDGVTTTILTASILLVTDDYATMSLIIPVTVPGTTFRIIPNPPSGFLTFPLAGTEPSTHATILIKKIADL